MTTNTLQENAVEASIEATIERYQEYISPGLANLMKFAGFDDVEMTAQGCIVKTVRGDEYLDCLGGYGVFSLGHRHPRVVEAVHRQLDRMPLSCRSFFNETTAELAEKLASVAPGGLQYTFFCNSGTEAVEGALKIARIATGRTRVVSTIGGFHGKTMGALSATGREVFRKPFEPLIAGFSHVPFNDVEAVIQALDDDTAAVIVEPIQGEGGIISATPGYLSALRRLCNERGALLIVDEVQTGMGRTGTLFAVEEEGVEPDILMLAKALGGGVMPIGAVMSTSNVWEKAFGTNPLIHTSTFGGNPLACSAALATLQVIEEENLVARARERGEQMLAGLRSVQARHPDALVEARGRGLMIGVEFAVKDVAELTINGMSRREIIAAYTLNNPKVIRFEPPLIITSEQVNRAVTVFGEAVEEAATLLAGL